MEVAAGVLMIVQKEAGQPDIIRIEIEADRGKDCRTWNGALQSVRSAYRKSARFPASTPTVR